MAQLKLGAIKDLSGVSGFTFTAGGVSANGALVVTDLVIDGSVSVLPWAHMWCQV